MRLCLAFVAGMLIAAAPGNANEGSVMGNVEVKIEKASGEVLARAAALGSMQFFESSRLLIRMYGFGVPGDCVPKARKVCGHRYVLLTSSLDEPPEIHAYDLGQVGEFTKVVLKGKNDDQLRRLELTVQNWPTQALKSNPRLARRTSRVALQIDRRQVELVE